MTMTQDAISNGNSGGSLSASLTISHNCAVNANYLLVGVVNGESDAAPNSISTVTYAGAGMTKIDDQVTDISKAIRTTLWKLVNPASGVNDIVITPAANSRMVGGGISFIDVNEDTPLGIAVKAIGALTVSVDVTDADGSGIVMNIVGKNNSSETLDVGAGQAEQWEDVTTNATAANNVRGAISTEVGSGTVAMSYAQANVNRRMAIIAVAVLPWPAPTVSNCVPDTGPIAGGTSVTLTGTEFRDGATVTFGGDAADNIVVVGPTEITCDTPAHAKGQVNIVVTNDDAQADTLVNGFEYYAPPTVTDCDPDSGPIAGGTSVTLTGTEFRDGATVTFGGDAADAVVVVGPTEITCDTPAHDVGLVDVVVTNDDAQADTLEDGFEYKAGNGGKSHSKRQFLGLI